MKTYRIELNSVYREVYEVKAETEQDARDVLLNEYCDRLEFDCLESDIIEIKQLEEANNG